MRNVPLTEFFNLGSFFNVELCAKLEQDKFVVFGHLAIVNHVEWLATIKFVIKINGIM